MSQVSVMIKCRAYDMCKEFIFVFIKAGLLLEKFPKYRFLLLFAWTSIIGVGNALLPFSGSLPTFFLICVLLGWSTGSLDTGIMLVLMLNLGGKVSQLMQLIILFFATCHYL